MSYDYWDLTSGLGLTDQELHERYDDMLDECVGDIVIGTLRYSTSSVLKAVDPIAYRVGFCEYVDAEIGETLSETEPNDAV